VASSVSPKNIIYGAMLVSRLTMPSIVFAIILASWEILTAQNRISPIVLPPPSDVAKAFFEGLPLLGEQAYYTIRTTLVALVIATLIGVLLGLVFGAAQRLRQALFPNVIFFELIPKIALAPLFIIWIGTGMELRIVFAVFLSFFPVLLATMTGLQAADPLAIRLCQALRASKMQTFVFVRLPYATPYIFSGIKIATTMAMIGVVVAEFLTGTTGLGYLIMFAATNLATPLMLAAVIFLCLAGMLLFWIAEYFERLFARRYGVPSG
jgi:NitT/TauT family transport system permease protein